jgi:hypothetical protein
MAFLAEIDPISEKFSVSKIDTEEELSDLDYIKSLAQDGEQCLARIINSEGSAQDVSEAVDYAVVVLEQTHDLLRDNPDVEAPLNVYDFANRVIEVMRSDQTTKLFEYGSEGVEAQRDVEEYGAQLEQMLKLFSSDGKLENPLSKLEMDRILGNNAYEMA